MIDRSRLELASGVWLDARRAVWLERERVLVVADLHLGYAWAHRLDGNLLPIGERDDTVERLEALVESYSPGELVLLGDIVHRAVPVAALKANLCELFERLAQRVTLRLVAGNHDAKLATLLSTCGLRADLTAEVRAGPHLLVHGDGLDETRAAAELEAAQARGGRVFIGHEHPAISISDGVTSGAKCPCFLVGRELLVLPAFSKWAAGTNVRRYPRMSAIARRAACPKAVAVIAGKLLPVAI